jgi:hypothetical protein
MRRRNFIKLAATASVAAAIAADPVARLSASIITRPRRWLEKPASAVCMNWGHPLAMGMQVIIPFTEGQGVTNGTYPILDACSNHNLQLVNTTGNVVWVENTPGKGLKMAGNGDYVFIPLPLPGTGSGTTVLMIRRKTDTTLRNVFTFGDVAFTLDRLSAHVPFSDGNVYWDFGGTSAPNRLTLSGLSWATVVEMWAFTAGGKGSTIWKDGQKLASQSTALNLAADKGGLNLGAGYDHNSDLQEFYFFAVAGEQWSDDLISWWFTDPYGMFVPLSPKTTYFFGSGGRKKPSVFVAM